MKKLGLVLGSSGARGVSYVGFIRALEEHGITPDYIAGSSMGAVVGGCYAIGMTASEMEREVLELKSMHLIDVSMRPVRNSAILRSNKMLKKLEVYFQDRTFDQTKIPFTCVAVDLLGAKLYSFSGKDNLAQGISASASIPAVFKPVEKDGMKLVDGGVLCRLPIEQVREMGAEVIVAVDALGETRAIEKDFNIISVIMRSYEVMDGVMTNDNIEKHKPDLVIRPDLGKMSQFKFKNFDTALEQGYKAGIENIEKIKELIKIFIKLNRFRSSS